MNETKKYLHEFYAVIVIYNQDLFLSDSFISLKNSLVNSNFELDLLVYDNSKESAFKKDGLEIENLNITYIHNPSNPGVGKAYNVAVEIASKSNKKWILILDQDSKFPINAINCYVNAVLNYPDIKLFAPLLISKNTIISPCVYKFRRGFAVKKIDHGIHALNTYVPINSGLLIDIAVFNKVGGYNENIKLDFSDFFFMSKLKKVISNFVLLDLTFGHLLSTFDESSNSIESVQKRYELFCSGGKHSVNSVIDFCYLFMVVFLRGLNLSFQFKNPYFLILFYKCFLRK